MVNDRMKKRIETLVDQAADLVADGYGFVLAAGEGLCQCCMLNHATDVALVKTTLAYRKWCVLMARCEVCNRFELKRAARRFVHHKLRGTSYDGMKRDFKVPPWPRRTKGEANGHRA